MDKQKHCHYCGKKTNEEELIFDMTTCKECADDIRHNFNYEISDTFIKGGIEALLEGL